MATADQSTAPQPLKPSWTRLGVAFLLGALITGFVFDRCFGGGQDQIQPNPYVRVTADRLVVRPNPIPGATAVEVAVFGPGGQETEQRGMPGDTFAFDLNALNLNPRQQVVVRYYRSVVTGGGPAAGEEHMGNDSMRTEDSFLGGDVDMGYHTRAVGERSEDCPPALTTRHDFTPNTAVGGGFFVFGDLATPETYEIKISGCGGLAAAQRIQIAVRRRLDGKVAVEVFDRNSYDCYAKTYLACNGKEIIFDETGCRLYVQESAGQIYVAGCPDCTIEIFR